MDAPHRILVADFRPALGIWRAVCSCGHAVNGPSQRDATNRLRTHLRSEARKALDSRMKENLHVEG